MTGILLLLIIFGGFGYAFYLLVTEGLGGQLSKIEQTQAHINEQHRKENKSQNQITKNRLYARKLKPFSNN